MHSGSQCVLSSQTCRKKSRAPDSPDILNLVLKHLETLPGNCLQSPRGSGNLFSLAGVGFFSLEKGMPWSWGFPLKAQMMVNLFAFAASSYNSKWVSQKF